MRCRDLSMIITLQSSPGGLGYKSESYTSGFLVPFRGHVYKAPSDDLLSLLRLFSRTTRTSHESIMFHKVESIFLLIWKKKNKKKKQVGQWLLFWEVESEKVKRRQKTSIFFKPLLHSRSLANQFLCDVIGRQSSIKFTNRWADQNPGLFLTLSAYI